MDNINKFQYYLDQIGNGPNAKLYSQLKEYFRTRFNLDQIVLGVVPLFFGIDNSERHAKAYLEDNYTKFIEEERKSKKTQTLEEQERIRIEELIACKFSLPQTIDDLIKNADLTVGRLRESKVFGLSRRVKALEDVKKIIKELERDGEIYNPSEEQSFHRTYKKIIDKISSRKIDDGLMNLLMKEGGGITIAEYWMLKWNLNFSHYYKSIDEALIDDDISLVPKFTPEQLDYIEKNLMLDRSAIEEVENGKKVISIIDGIISRFLEERPTLTQCRYFGNSMGVRMYRILARSGKHNIASLKQQERYKEEARKLVSKEAAKEIDSKINPFFDKLEELLERV